MAKTISRIQKVCMFAGTAVFGLPTIGKILWEEHLGKRFSGAALFAMICYFVFLGVLGAWFGGAVSLVWRSPAGTQWFWALSGGSAGGALAAVGATNWMVARAGGPPSRSLSFESIVFGSVVLVGMLFGSLIGWLVGYERAHAAEMQQTDEQ